MPLDGDAIQVIDCGVEWSKVVEGLEERNTEWQ